MHHEWMGRRRGHSWTFNLAFHFFDSFWFCHFTWTLRDSVKVTVACERSQWQSRHHSDAVTKNIREANSNYLKMSFERSIRCQWANMRGFCPVWGRGGQTTRSLLTLNSTLKFVCCTVYSGHIIICNMWAGSVWPSGIMSLADAFHSIVNAVKIIKPQASEKCVTFSQLGFRAHFVNTD